MDRKIKKAEQAIRERFTAIEAALKDLCPDAFGILTQQEIVGNKLLATRYQNRLMSMFLLIYHLRDDVRRLAKRRGFEEKIIDDFIRRAQPVSLCIRAGDTHKHGLGGRSKNATISNGLIKVVKAPKGTKPTPSSDVIIIGMMLVDSENVGGNISFIRTSNQSAYLTCGQTCLRKSRSTVPRKTTRIPTCQNIGHIQFHQPWAIALICSIIFVLLIFSFSGKYFD